MIIQQFYINTDVNQALSLTQLELDELELVVGRFRSNHYCRAGQLKGLLQIHIDGTITIVNHFNKKLLWTNKE